MSAYFIAPDGEDEPTIWRANPDRPELPTAVARRCEGPELFGMVERVLGLLPAWEAAIGSEHWDHGSDYVLERVASELRAALEGDPA